MEKSKKKNNLQNFLINRSFKTTFGAFVSLAVIVATTVYFGIKLRNLFGKKLYNTLKLF